MTLYLEPESDFDEPPFSEKREKLYAPVGPFADAIDHWIDYQRRQTGVSIPDRRRRYSSLACRDNDLAGLNQLAELAGMTARTLCRYRRRDAGVIELYNADRLALALDIPLSLLAEDFKPLGAFYPRGQAAA